MRRLQFCVIAALMLLLLCACTTSQPSSSVKPQVGQSATKPTAAQTGTDAANPLRDQTVVKIDFVDLVNRSKSLSQTLATLGAIAFTLALLEILFGGRSWKRWAVLMVLIMLWPSISNVFSAWAGGDWTLTREFLDETLGLKKGLLPTGDLMTLIPWAKNAISWTVDLICLTLRVTHGLFSWAFFLAVIPLVLQNYLAMTMGNRRFQTSLIVLLLTLGTFRHYLPEMLARETTRLHATRVEVISNLPLVKELAEPLLNTIKGTAQQTTLNFIGTWWVLTFGLLAIAVVFAITLSTIAAPYVEFVSNKVGRTAKRYGGVIQRGVRKAARASDDRGQDQGSRPVSQREFNRRLTQTEETLRQAAKEQQVAGGQKSEPPPSGWRQINGGLLVPNHDSPSRGKPDLRSAQGSVAGNDPAMRREQNSKKTAAKLAGIATGGVASKVINDPSGSARTAGAVATAAGHPEVGAPLVAAGSAIEKGKSRRNRQESGVGDSAEPERLTEDPRVTQERDALDEALAGFFGGGEEGGGA